MSANLLFIIVNRREDLGQILRVLREAGVGGSTVIESSGMGRTMSESLPLFGGLRHLEDGLRTHNHTLFALIRDHGVLENAKESVLKLMDGFSEEGSGMMMVLPVSEVWGGCDDVIGGGHR